MRNDLNRFSEKTSLAFFLDDRQVDLPRRVVAITRQGAAGESFVVAEVQIGLAAVIKHIHFPVLIRAHRARIHVDVGVELLHSNPQSA